MTLFQISWVRRRDWHILTSGMFTYTNDERFQVLHGEGSDDWTLQIKYVQKRDNGTYECQVHTCIFKFDNKTCLQGGSKLHDNISGAVSRTESRRQ